MGENSDRRLVAETSTSSPIRPPVRSATLASSLAIAPRTACRVHRRAYLGLIYPVAQSNRIATQTKKKKRHRCCRSSSRLETTQRAVHSSPSRQTRRRSCTHPSSSTRRFHFSQNPSRDRDGSPPTRQRLTLPQSSRSPNTRSRRRRTTLRRLKTDPSTDRRRGARIAPPTPTRLPRTPRTLVQRRATPREAAGRIQHRS